MFRQIDAHTDTKIVFLFTYVTFLGLSYVTYGSEMSYTQTAMTERVKQWFPTVHSGEVTLSIT